MANFTRVSADSQLGRFTMFIVKESGLPSVFSCRYRQTPEYTTQIGSPRIWAAPCLVYSLLRFGDFTRSKALSFIPRKLCHRNGFAKILQFQQFCKEYQMFVYTTY